MYKRAFTLIELPVVRKRAFTLIELLITVFIIILMTVLAIPAFNKYGDKSSFKLQASEIQTLINQTSIMAKNPEQNVSRYLIKVDVTASAPKIGLYKTDDSTTNNLIKEIFVSTDYTLAVQNDTAPFTKIYLVVNSPSDFACQSKKVLTVIPDCNAANKLDGIDFLTMNGGDAGSATFKIYSDPFRVEY